MRVLVWLVMLMVYLEAESRVALLIGNSSYGEKRLENPGHDVDLLAKKLQELDFTVIKKKNLNKSETVKALKKFYRQIDKDTIALIYFSGHGVHSTIDNKNYLMPIGAFDALINEEDLSNEAISDGKLLASTSGAKFSILLLDACRSNDFAKVRGDKGLGQPQSRLNNDYVISYATEVGKTAKDGNRNSPYALALAEYLSKGFSIGDIFTKVRAKVSRSTGGKQKPYYAPHFENILYLNDVANAGQNVIRESKIEESPLLVKQNPNAKVMYIKNCKVCHDNDALGAPKVGSSLAWKKVMKKGFSKVLKNAIYGRNGMPPKGATDLSDAEMEKIVKYMINISMSNKTTIMKKPLIQQRTLKTTYSKVALYKKPSLDANIIIKLSRNSIVTYLKVGDDSNWIKIRTISGLEGWVEKKRVKEI